MKKKISLEKLATRLRLISFKEFSGQKYGSYKMSNEEFAELYGVDDLWMALHWRDDEYFEQFICDLNVFCLRCGIYLIRLYDGIAVADIGLVGSFREVPSEIVDYATIEIK